MAKGGQFERDFSRQLSLWWTNGERDDIFWRTAGSGARATVRSKKGKTTAGQYGDITATDPDGKLLIDNILFELKNGYPDAEIEKLINYGKATKGTDLYSKWIDKCDKSCKDSGIPGWAIIHKRAGREPLVTMNQNAYWSFIADKKWIRKLSPVFIIRLSDSIFYHTVRLDTLLQVPVDQVRKCLQNSK